MMPDTKRKKIKHAKKNEYKHSVKKEKMFPATSSRFNSNCHESTVDAPISIHSTSRNTKSNRSVNTPLQYTFGSIPLSSSGTRNFQSKSSMKLRRSARLQGTTSIVTVSSASKTIVDDESMTSKWFITPACNTNTIMSQQIKRYNHSHASLSSCISSNKTQQIAHTKSDNEDQELDNENFYIEALAYSAQHPPSSSVSVITQSTLHSGGNTNSSFSNCWSSSISTQEDLHIDNEYPGRLSEKMKDDNMYCGVDEKVEKSKKRKHKSQKSDRSKSNLASSKKSRLHDIKKKSLTQIDKNMHQNDGDIKDCLLRGKARSQLFSDTPPNPSQWNFLSQPPHSSSPSNSSCNSSVGKDMHHQPLTKKKHHRYRLRSLSCQSMSDDDFSYDDKEENSMQKFMDMDDLSSLILSAKQRGYFQSSVFKSDTSLTCAYLESYGTAYYECLLEREQLQFERSQKRLDEYSTDQEQNTYQQRMRTRSCCKIEEKMNSKPYLHEHQRSKFFPDKACKRDVGNLAQDKINNSYSEKSSFSNPRYFQMGKQKNITIDMRSVLVDWIIDVSMEFKQSHETLHYCICLIDRCLEDIVVTKGTFHSLGCACLLIASKLIEKKHPRAADIAYFTNNACTVTDICTMELKITMMLQFHLQLVTSFQFVERFLNASHLHISGGSNGNRNKSLDISQYSFIVNPKLECVLMYFVDMSLLIPELVDSKKSLVVAAALYLARGIVGLRDSSVSENCFWSDALTHYTGYNADELVDTVAILHKHQRNLSDKGKHRMDALNKKYSSKEYFEVAKKSSILIGDLRLCRKLK